MKRALVIIALFAVTAFAESKGPQVIAADSNGVVVQVKEKYGSYVIDTCTVVMLTEGQFVLVHREGGSGWYPTSFHSVQVLQSLGQAAKPGEDTAEQPLAMAVVR